MVLAAFETSEADQEANLFNLSVAKMEILHPSILSLLISPCGRMKLVNLSEDIYGLGTPWPASVPKHKIEMKTQSILE